MWKYCWLASALVTTVMGGTADFTITPSSQVAYYHYPAPPKSQQVLHEPQHLTTNRQYAPSLQTYQNQQLYHQQQSSQSRYFSQSTGKSQYPSSSNNFYHSSTVTKQFTSPALDKAAFTMALTNQGFTTRSNALRAPASSSLTLASATTSQAQLSPLLASSITGSSSNSLNVKLPLPFNTTPLNIAPLPLQAGTPYSAIQNGVTSYGTTYPQRRRR